MVPRRLLILACSQRKRPGTDRMPAIQRYDGPLWQTLRTLSYPKAAVMFLSAKYGFGPATAEIEDYDRQLTEDTVTLMVRNARSQASFDTRRSARVVASLSAGGPFTEVCLVGSALYLRAMRAEVRYWKTLCWREDWNAIAPDARVKQINGPIGVMRKQLRTWLMEAA